MANTVISIFEDFDSARQVEKYLWEQGFPQSDISIKTAVYKQESGGGLQINDHQNVMDAIRGFFKDLFGDDDDKVSTYHQASKDRTIVSVHTNTDEEAQQVVSILDQYGAINVHQTAGSFFPDEQNFSRASEIKSRIVQRSLGNQSGID